ncbi:MAG TPA: Crp/Fnr family transcriptional regulator [Stellaceae bacterium]|nr:Crp/Fnr family transcriptional regulator [Stellaceae bacterium]
MRGGSGQDTVPEHKNPEFDPPRGKRETDPVRPPEGIPASRWGDADLIELFRDEPSGLALQPGEVLFKEGDPGACLYVVRSGTLRIRSGSVVFEDVSPGGIVGEMALVDQHMPRSATVYALTPAELIIIDEPRFFALVARNPSFAITVMRVLSRRLRHMDTRYRLARWPEPDR